MKCTEVVNEKDGLLTQVFTYNSGFSHRFTVGF